MKCFIMLITAFALSACSSEKSDAVSSSNFIYDLNTLRFTIYSYITEDISVGIGGNIKLIGGSERVHLSDNDQLNLISPTGTVTKGENAPIAYSSELECCHFLELDNRTLTEIQANNDWRIEFKRQGIVEDNFTIQFPSPIDIENSETLSVSPEQDFILKFSGTHSTGLLSVTMDSTCFEVDTGISQELKESDNTVTIPLNYTEGCEDPDAKIKINYNAEATINTTTNLLNVPINSTPNLHQYIELPLKIN